MGVPLTYFIEMGHYYSLKTRELEEMLDKYHDQFNDFLEDYMDNIKR